MNVAVINEAWEKEKYIAEMKRSKWKRKVISMKWKMKNKAISKKWKYNETLSKIIYRNSKGRKKNIIRRIGVKQEESCWELSWIYESVISKRKKMKNITIEEKYRNESMEEPRNGEDEKYIVKDHISSKQWKEDMKKKLVYVKEKKRKYEEERKESSVKMRKGYIRNVSHINQSLWKKKYDSLKRKYENEEQCENWS